MMPLIGSTPGLRPRLYTWVFGGPVNPRKLPKVATFKLSSGAKLRQLQHFGFGRELMTQTRPDRQVRARDSAHIASLPSGQHLKRAEKTFQASCLKQVKLPAASPWPVSMAPALRQCQLPAAHHHQKAALEPWSDASLWRRRGPACCGAAAQSRPATGLPSECSVGQVRLPSIGF